MPTSMPPIKEPQPAVDRPTTFSEKLSEPRMAKLAYLSMIVTMVVLPTRLGRIDESRGPRRTVSLYIVACFGYYVALLFVIPRLG